MMKKPEFLDYNITKKDAFVALLVAAMFGILALPVFIKPKSFVGYEALRRLHRTLGYTFFSMAAGSVLAVILTAYFSVSLVRIIKRYKIMIDSTGTINGAGYILLVMVRTVLFLIIVVFASCQFMYHDMTILCTSSPSVKGLVSEYEKLSSDKHNGKLVTAEISNIKVRGKASYFGAFGHSRYTSGKDKTNGSFYYWIVTEDGVRLPVSVKNANNINDTMADNKNKDCRMTVTYYSRSKVIVSYKIEMNKKPLDLNEVDSIEDFGLSRVEISMDDDLVISGPRDMSKYGDMAWIITGDLARYTLDDWAEDTPFSMMAENSTLDLNTYRRDLWDYCYKEGAINYQVTLVKIIAHGDLMTGSYDDYDYVPVSNTLEFRFVEGDEVLKELGGRKVKIEADKDELTAYLPDLGIEPFVYADDLKLFVDYSDNEDHDNEGEFRWYERYRPDSTIDLPDESRYYTIYLGVEKKGGDIVKISNVVEFDNREFKDSHYDEVYEYFDIIVDAMEDNDIDPVMKLLANDVYTHYEDHTYSLEQEMQQIFDLYKGKRIKDPGSEPHLDNHFLEYYDGGQQFEGTWEFSTDQGNYKLIFRVWCNSEDSDLNGLYYLKLINTDTNEDHWIDDDYTRSKALEPFRNEYLSQFDFDVRS